MHPATLPLNLFDPRTIIVMASVMSLMMAGVIFFLRRIYPPNIHGLLHWAIAPVLCSISTALFAARGFIPDLISSAGSNLILLAGATIFYFGSQRFLTSRPPINFGALCWWPQPLRLCGLLPWTRVMKCGWFYSQPS